MGADCKSVGLRLPRFESWTCHLHEVLHGVELSNQTVRRL
jgi:hypothetical protein